MDSVLHQVIEEQWSTVAITASVAEAIALLSQTQQPCLVVIEPESCCCLGLFTERDGIALIAKDCNTLHQPLSAHVNSTVPTVSISALDSLDTVAALFDQHQLPALPVVNDAGQPIGLITLSSLWRGLRQTTQQATASPLASPSPSSATLDLELNLDPLVTLAPQDILQELQQAKARLELFFTQSLDGFFFMMLDHPVRWDNSVDKDRTLDYVFVHQRVTKVNDAMLKQYGAEREQFMGLTPAVFFAHNLEHGRQVWRQFFDAGQLHVETQERKFDGTPMWIEGDYICLYDEQGNITGHFGVQREVTSRKCAEASLRESEARWQLIIQASHDGIFDIDLATGVGFYSDRFKAMLGYQPHEFANTREQWVELLHPDDRDRVLTAKAAYLEHRQPELIQEYRLRCKDGSYRWIFDRVLAVWDDAGNPIKVVGSCTDITSHKQTEADLKKRERYLAALVDIQRQLLATKGHHHYYQAVLETLGAISEASRVYLFENHWDTAGNMLMSQRAEWCAEGILAEIDNPDLQNMSYLELFPRWAASLSRGESIHGRVADFPASERLILEPQGIQAILILPLLLEDHFFGFIGFDNCESGRGWNAVEIDLLSAAAAAISLHQRHFQTHQKQHQMEQALRLIVEGTAAKIGQDFLRSLVRQLAKILDVRYAFIAELVGPDKNRARTLAFWQGDQWGDNIEYDLAGTPCEQVAVGEIIYYPDSVQSRFPQHQHLADLAAESYLGIPLNNALGEVFGYLKVLDDRPLRDQAFSEQILRIFAARVGAELERKQAEDAMAILLTQAQDQARDLEKAKQAAEIASRAKSDFLAHMSHELRTPLNAILGFTQIINRLPNLPGDVQDYITIIGRSGQHLLTLINDVLEMSKIEAGRLRLQVHDVDLYQLLDNIYEMLSLKATAQGLNLTFERLSQVPQYITVDEGKLRQVLLNLLGNALKFTSQGQVSLHIKATAIHGDRTATMTLSFAVEDTGPGIAPEDVPRLFKPFVQTRTGKQYNEGTGLGLTISQKFVQLMGGTITVESVVNQGSIFRFQIPVTSASTAIHAAEQPTQRVVGVHPCHLPCRVLIVEDHWDNQQVLLKLLQPLGFDLQVAQNGQDAILLWAQWQPHAILMDIRMPIMDGYEAIQQIRAQEQQSRVATEFSTHFAARPTTKIIAVTSGAFDQERSIILESGCDDFISKPFQEQELLTKLAQHLDLTYQYVAHKRLERKANQESTVTSLEPPRLLTEALTLDGLPKEWVFQLHQAATLGRDTHILRLIQQLPEPQSQLSRALSQWVEDFEFEPILALTRAAGYD